MVRFFFKDNKCDDHLNSLVLLYLFLGSWNITICAFCRFTKSISTFVIMHTHFTTMLQRDSCLKLIKLVKTPTNYQTGEVCTSTGCEDETTDDEIVPPSVTTDDGIVPPSVG